MDLAGSESIRVATNRTQLLARQRPFRFVAYESTSQHADDSADHADYYATASSMATMPDAATANSPTAAVCPRWRTGPRIQADSARNPPRQSNSTCSSYLSQVLIPTRSIDHELVVPQNLTGDRVPPHHGRSAMAAGSRPAHHSGRAERTTLTPRLRSCARVVVSFFRQTFGSIPRRYTA